MVFSSLLFLFRYLPLVLLFYFLVPRPFKNLILFVSSLIFYAWGEPIYVWIMLFSTVVDFVHGKLVYSYRKKGDQRAAKICVASSVLINLGLLCFFKYTDFFIGIVNGVFRVDLPLLHLPLPIGISFYTFQTMSYTIDVYRDDAKVQNNILAFGTYVAMFPQLIAGPIVRYRTIEDQLLNRRENVDYFSYGAGRFLMGIGKKVLLANNIGILWDTVKGMEAGSITVAMAWLGIIAFAFQIYFDFSGYSDMAIGLGNMFGFQFLENFNYPYMSKSITEFWHRWHISLSSWFKEYVYIPLGGNRKGKIFQLRNIVLVWALTGIWHGASFHFLAWGLYFGFLLLIEKFFLLKFLKRLPAWLSWIYAIFFILIGWVIFAFDSMWDGVCYIGVMFGIGAAGIIDSRFIYLFLSNVLLLIILIAGATDLPARTVNKYNRNTVFEVLKNLWYVGIFLLSLAYLVDATYNPFLYFRF